MLALAVALTLSASPYDDARARLDVARNGLAAMPESEQRRARARAVLTRALVDELIPAWFGTEWDYSGTSTTPQSGTIACGYFVTTLLEHAGLRLQRVKLAQQASERIVTTLVRGAGPIVRMRDAGAAAVIERVRAHGDGVWVVGLDNHTGFVVIEGERADFCHSSYVGKRVVVCEPATSSDAFVSRYRVLGKLFDDDAVDRWLAGRSFDM